MSNIFKKMRQQAFGGAEKTGKRPSSRTTDNLELFDILTDESFAVDGVTSLMTVSGPTKSWLVTLTMIWGRIRTRGVQRSPTADYNSTAAKVLATTPATGNKNIKASQLSGEPLNLLLKISKYEESSRAHLET
ncbi:hypothetical protein J6590_084277 [Homalodisca vitripennis]|nr:hypothetical protein J6590_084277 [Homalodisca vitripennis]